MHTSPLSQPLAIIRILGGGIRVLKVQHKYRVTEGQGQKPTHQSPQREIDGLPTSTSNSESENEDHDLSSSIESGRHQEVVLAEPCRPIPAQVVLGKDSHAEGGEDGTIDADGEISEGPAKNRGDDLVRAELGELLVNKPERERDGKSNQDTERYNLQNGQLCSTRMK